MLTELLKQRNLPGLLSREEMLNILQDQVYGFMPEAPEDLRFEVQEQFIRSFCAGKAVCNRITAHCTVNGKPYSFPFYASVPTMGQALPFFIHINFRDNIPDLYLPIEELIDHGYCVFSFCYKDVTSDDGDLSNGLAGNLYPNGTRAPNEAGKIAMWAWAAQRIMDYAQTMGALLDLNCGIVCGHSRLGKTALLTAATDPRFAFAYSNDSGCSGAALSRGKAGETIQKICDRFPYWFCENYLQYADKEDAMPFDQHYLLASIAPRYVMVGSAQEDSWADPISEQLCCAAAAPAFPDGFVCSAPAKPGDAFLEGTVGYQLRSGTHYFSRYDWLRLMEFVSLHRSKS